MAASIQAYLFFMVVLRGKARYQRGHSAHYRDFKLATSTLMLCIFDVVLYSHL